MQDEILNERIHEKVMGRVNGFHTPQYSKDISAAWLVLKKMISEKYSVRMSTVETENGVQWYVIMDSSAGAPYTALDRSPELAICIAANKAVSE